MDLRDPHMMDMTGQIVAMVPPPLEPVCSGCVDGFSGVEQMLGIELPPDYKNLILRYGDGCWQNFWWILNPFSSNKYLNLVERVSEYERFNYSGEGFWRNSKEDYSYNIWPEPSGLFPWAFTENAGVFFWSTCGTPTQWTTVYFADDCYECESIPLTASEIVYGAITGNLDIFEEEFGGLGSQGNRHFRSCADDQQTM